MEFRINLFRHATLGKTACNYEKRLVGITCSRKRRTDLWNDLRFLTRTCVLQLSGGRERCSSDDKLDQSASNSLRSRDPVANCKPSNHQSLRDLIESEEEPKTRAGEPHPAKKTHPRGRGWVFERLESFRRPSDDDWQTVQEIFWDLVCERVISPGRDSANPTFPSFRVHSETAAKLSLDK